HSYRCRVAALTWSSLTATAVLYTLSLHDALPISASFAAVAQGTVIHKRHMADLTGKPPGSLSNFSIHDNAQTDSPVQQDDQCVFSVFGQSLTRFGNGCRFNVVFNKYWIGKHLFEILFQIKIPF